MFTYLKDLFERDEWVASEYSGGFITHVMAEADNLEEVLAMGEVALNVSA